MMRNSGASCRTELTHRVLGTERKPCLLGILVELQPDGTLAHEIQKP